MTQNEGYRATLVVDNTPEEVFAAITNVRGCWSETIEGKRESIIWIYRVLANPESVGIERWSSCPASTPVGMINECPRGG